MMVPDTPSIERMSDLLADPVGSTSHGLETEPSVPTDTLFSVLSHRHRRHALSYLLGRDGPVAVEAIVSHVVAQLDRSGEDVHNRVALRFQHNHFPKLAEAGLIEYDRDERIVAPTDTTAAVGPHLALASA